MKNRIQEVFIPIKMFYRLKSKGEVICYISIPVIISIILTMYLKMICINVENFNIIELLNDNINTLINVMALFISFSMAYLSILISSSSKNIDELKQTTSSLYTFNQQPVYLFQVLVTDLTYSVFVEVILLAFLFIEKFIIIISSINLLYIQLIINQCILVHIIMVLIRNIKNIYLSFWKSN